MSPLILIEFSHFLPPHIPWQVQVIIPLIGGIQLLIIIISCLMIKKKNFFNFHLRNRVRIIAQMILIPNLPFKKSGYNIKTQQFVNYFLSTAFWTLSRTHHKRNLEVTLISGLKLPQICPRRQSLCGFENPKQSAVHSQKSRKSMQGDFKKYTSGGP